MAHDACAVNRRLRLLHVLFQPVVVWDDGESIEPGPVLEVKALSLAEFEEAAARIPAELEALAAQIERESPRGD